EEHGVTKSFGNGVFARARVTNPVGSNPGRSGSRPNTLKDERGPVAPADVTGLPCRSTVGLLDVAMLLWTPGKYRKMPSRASAVSTEDVIDSLVIVRIPS